jgi:hypothetical protein
MVRRGWRQESTTRVLGDFVLHDSRTLFLEWICAVEYEALLGSFARIGIVTSVHFCAALQLCGIAVVLVNPYNVPRGGFVSGIVASLFVWKADLSVPPACLTS